jgi:hypothetical protein
MDKNDKFSLGYGRLTLITIDTILTKIDFE